MAKVLPSSEARVSRLGSELGDSGPGAVLVLLGRAAADSARAVEHARADDRHRALARDHVTALGRGDALDDRAARALGQLAAGSGEAGRRHRLALRAVDAAPDRPVHAVERDQPAAGIAYGHADPDVHLPRLLDRALNDLVGFRERQRHGVTS